MTPLPRPPRDDRGAALLVVVVMLALVSALTMTLAVITTTNLQSARQAQQAGAAVNAADAGVAQAITYLRTTGVATLNKCSPTCVSDPWGNRANPARVQINGKAGQEYRVWIEPVAPYPANKPGTYRIHSSGIAGGPAARRVTVDVSLDSYRVPFGILSNSVVGGGDAGVHHASVFSTGCVYQRSKIQFEGIDVAYNIPAAVHSSQVITDSQGSGQYCPSTKKPIHDPTDPNPATRNCNPAYPYDQDKFGGPLRAADGSWVSACYDRARAEFPTMPVSTDPTSVAYKYPQTSYLRDDQMLADVFNMRQPAFTQAQLDQLRTVAISQGNYWRTAKAAAQGGPSGGWTVPTDPHSVLYFDLATSDPGGVVDFNYLDDGSGRWSRDPDISDADARCEPRSLVIVIEGGNARLNSNSTLYASAFLISGDPYGKVFKANGTSTFIGTLYSNHLDLTGTADVHLDKCFLANTSPALFTVESFAYREIDR